MKKLVAFLLSFILLLSISIVACADNETSFFEPSIDSQQYSCPRPNGYFIITGSLVNLRSLPSTSSSSGGLLDKGDTACFHPDDPNTTVYDTWPHVLMTNGRNIEKGGYVYHDYITFVENPT